VSNKAIDAEAYKKHLLSSPLFEVIANKMYGNDYLALALLFTLSEKGIVDPLEVNERYDQILRARLTESLEMEIDGELTAPDEFMVDEDDQSE